MWHGGNVWIERLREGLIFAAVVFGPWAFGTTQNWSIWTMNLLGYAVGIATLLLVVRRVGIGDARLFAELPKSARGVMRILLLLTLLIIGYVCVSYLNAAADYDRRTQTFAYRDYFISWLPHTFNRHATGQMLWKSLAWTCFFWGTVDWLRGSAANSDGRLANSFLVSARFRRLLWLLCINGAVLALEAVVQRALNSSKLLFLVQPQVNPGVESQFGPFAYRGNAAQYLNLVWPVAVGFWLTLQRVAQQFERGAKDLGIRLRHVLIVCALITATGPLVSTSRAGALIMAGNAVAVVFISLFALRAGAPWPRWSLVAALVMATGFGVQLGWKRLSPRMESISADFIGRERLYDVGRKIAADYPVFGTGPGSLDSIYQIYRESPEQYWPVQLHNDWLETLATFGWVGASMIWLALGLVLSRWCLPGAIRGGKYFVGCVWVSIAGCLVHARWDFPFQVYSIVHLFLTICAVLFCLSRTKAR